MINKILLLALYAFYSMHIFAQDPADPYQFYKDTSKNILFIPLYENVYGDYRQSQTIRYAVKWGSFGLIPAAFFGKYEFWGTPAILTSVVAAPVLGVIGGYFGRKYGNKLNETKSTDIGFASKLYTFGHELSHDKLLISESKNRLYDVSTRYSIVMQKRTNSYFIPEEIRLGYSWKGRHSPLYDHYDLWENRYNLDLLFNSSGNIIQIHYGIGGGYSWGDLNEHIQGGDWETVKLNDVKGVFIYPVIGVTVNLYDFFYFRIDGKYEFSSFNGNIPSYFGNPDKHYIVVNFAYGTYLF